MKKIITFFQKIMSFQHDYFQEHNDEIHIRNLKLMQTISYIGIVLFIVYYLVTAIIFPQLSISPWYGIIIFLLSIYLFYLKKAKVNQYFRLKTARIVTLIFYLLLIGYIIIMSVFPHQELPSVYYPLFLVMAPVVFILPAVWHIVFSLVSLLIFYLLVFKFKLPEVWSHELFEATTAFVFSCVVNILMTQFRLQSDNLKNRYYQLSREDVLTGVLNKETGQYACRQYLLTKKRKTACAALFIDVDNFKTINDTYGHSKGDEILKEVGKMLKSICRKDDLVFRFGGDEFLILLKDIDNDTNAKEKAKTILILANQIGEDKQLKLSCSIGICYAAKANISMEELFEKADYALYQSKLAGRNRYTLKNLEE